MPKSQEIHPEELFSSGSISFTDIPVNAYSKTLAEEKELFSREDFLSIYHDMCLLRCFETIIDTIKKEGSYKGVQYTHGGPAHLSIGQESAAVGQAFALNVNDWIFGSHRSHSEILAKGLSAIRELSDQRLMEIMEGAFEGEALRAVEKGHSGSVAQLARRYLVYGAYAEIFARLTGFNKGWGGSMHAFFRPFGIFPNNAIVGGSGSIAPGAALFKRCNGEPGIVVANIGDGSFGCGPVWEGICFASMDQYRKLWDEAEGGGLPIIFNCSDNQYGMGGQTSGETMGFGSMARIGAGVNPEQMHTERINGYDPLAVADAITRKKEILAQGRGPVMLDTLTYRVSGHSPSDASSYRTAGELERWSRADAIGEFREKLTKGDIASGQELQELRDGIEEFVFEMFKLSIDDDVSPREPIDSLFADTVMFSNSSVEKLADRTPETNHSLEENPQYKRIAAKERFAFDSNGKPFPAMKVYNFRDAVFEAMMHRFYIDPTMVAFGEENRDWGGAFACYRGMTEALPYHRLFNSPISEAGIVGAAAGYALSGGRAVAELMYCDFMGRAGDEIFNQLSKWQAMSGGVLRMPVVLRIAVGFKYGAQHSQEWSAMVNHIPGLKVVYPVTPYDAKGMLNAALAGTDPVIFLESQQLYGRGEEFVEGGVPREYYEIDLSEPVLRKSGKDLTIVTLGPTLYKALETAVVLEEKHGVSTEVIDLRVVNPLNYDMLVESVSKTGKILLVSEAVERGNVMHSVASNISQFAFDSLDAPPVVIGSRNWVTPAAELEEMFFPQVSWLLDAVHERIMPLKDYTPAGNKTLGELRRRSRLGI